METLYYTGKVLGFLILATVVVSLVMIGVALAAAVLVLVPFYLLAVWLYRRYVA